MSLTETAKVLGSSFSGSECHFHGCSIDTRTLKKEELFVAIQGERFDGHDFVETAREQGAAAALVEHSVASPLTQIRVSNTRHAMGKLASHWRSRFTLPLVAITGSNGKTTVKEMVSAILALDAPVMATQGNLNNDIGVPLTLYRLNEAHRYAVIEMGANHPGEIAWLSEIASPSVAVITQCAPAHLEGFGSVEGVARAKAEIYGGLVEGGIAVINVDDPYASLWLSITQRMPKLTFGINSPADITARDIHFQEDTGRQNFTLKTPGGQITVNLQLPGQHNVMNALASAACAYALEANETSIKDGLERVEPVKGRLEPKPGLKGSLILDDTYNANPVSLRAGIEVMCNYPKRPWLILGDMGELGAEAEAFHREAGSLAKERGIERLFAIGPLSEATAEAFNHNAEHFDSREALIERVQPLLASDVILLVKGSRAMGMEHVVKAIEERARC